MILDYLDCLETPVTRAPPVLRVLRVNRDCPVCRDTRVIRAPLDLQALKARQAQMALRQFPQKLQLNSVSQLSLLQAIR